MSRPIAPAPARAAARLLAVALALALTGCGAGFQAQTYQERTVADVSNTAVGPLALRGVSIVPDRTGVVEAGSDAVVRMTVVSTGAEDDTLVEASSPVAEQADLVRQPGEQVVDELDVPALGTTGDTAGVVLRGLSERLRAGEYLELTLRFARAGEVTLEVPVATTGVYDEDRERSENFHPVGEGEGGEGSGAESGTSSGLGEAGEESTETQ